MTSPGGVEGLEWVNTKYATKSDDWPDIEFHFEAGTPVSDGGLNIRLNDGITDAAWNAY